MMKRHLVTSVIIVAASIVAFYFPDHKGLSVSIAANLWWVWKG